MQSIAKLCKEIYVSFIFAGVYSGISVSLKGKSHKITTDIQKAYEPEICPQKLLTIKIYFKKRKMQLRNQPIEAFQKIYDRISQGAGETSDKVTLAGCGEGVQQCIFRVQTIIINFATAKCNCSNNLVYISTIPLQSGAV